MEIKQPGKEYSRNNHIIHSCQYHVVFCPKYRRSVLVDGIDDRLKEILIEKQEDFSYKVLDQEVMKDHVHILINVNPVIGIVKTVRRIKGYTSHILREEFPSLKKRLPTLWTRSSFISTVGAVTLEVVKRYIDEQKNV